MRSIGVVLVVAFATLLHAAGWYLLHDRVSPPNVVGQLASVSFSPIAAGHDGEKDVTTKEQIRSDLAVIAPYTRAIRTYSVGNGLAAVPELASEFGLHVTLGAWIDEWEEQNEREMETAIELSKRHRNIDSIIVGNETLYRSSVFNRGPWRPGSDRQDPEGEAPGLGAGDHRRGLEYLARASRACLRSRLPRRAHSALLGRDCRARSRSITR